MYDVLVCNVRELKLCAVSSISVRVTVPATVRVRVSVACRVIFRSLVFVVLRVVSVCGRALSDGLKWVVTQCDVNPMLLHEDIEHCA